MLIIILHLACQDFTFYISTVSGTTYVPVLPHLLPDVFLHHVVARWKHQIMHIKHEALGRSCFIGELTFHRSSQVLMDAILFVCDPA